MENWIKEYSDCAEKENERRMMDRMCRTIYPSAWGDSLPFEPDNDYFRKSCVTFVREALKSVRKRGYA